MSSQRLSSIADSIDEEIFALETKKGMYSVEKSVMTIFYNLIISLINSRISPNNGNNYAIKMRNKSIRKRIRHQIQLYTSISFKLFLVKAWFFIRNSKNQTLPRIKEFSKIFITKIKKENFLKHREWKLSFESIEEYNDYI